MTGSLRKRLGRLLAGPMIAALLSGCATAQDKAATYPITLNVSKEGKIEFLANGRPLPRCQLCTEEMEKKFGKGCKAAILNPPLCASTAGTATLHSVEQFTVVTSSGSPGCATLFIAGVPYSIPPCW